MLLACLITYSCDEDTIIGTFRHLLAYFWHVKKHTWNAKRFRIDWISRLTLFYLILFNGAICIHYYKKNYQKLNMLLQWFINTWTKRKMSHVWILWWSWTINILPENILDLSIELKEIIVLTETFEYTPLCF